MSRNRLLGLCSAFFLQAATFGQQQLDVPSTTYPTIASAITAASDGDMIVVANHPSPPGFWDLPDFYDLDFSGGSSTPKRITIRSANGPESCIINLGSSHVAFNFDSHEDQQSVLQGFTFQSDSAQTTTTPAITCTASSPRIVNCRFVNRVVQTNTSEVLGSAIQCKDHGNPVITHCEFVNNRAEAQHDTGVGTYTSVHDSEAFGALWHRAVWNQSSGCPSE